MVPYALKLLADTPGGVAALQQCRFVMFGGAVVPKDLGDNLTRQGVRLISFFGSTEVGVCLSSMRDFEADKGWDLLRPVPSFAPFLDWKPRSEGRSRDGDGDGDEVEQGRLHPSFEMVVRAGWAPLQTTNRADGGYDTSDIFERYSEDGKDTRWRFVGRNDDTIVLSNGENANPAPLEDAVRSSPLVRECVVYGQGQPNLVMLIVPAGRVDSKEGFVDEIWDLVESGNAKVPGYAKISRDAIGILSEGTVSYSGVFLHSGMLT